MHSNWWQRYKRDFQVYPDQRGDTVIMSLRFDNGDVVTMPTAGYMEAALEACKARNLGGEILQNGEVVGRARRTASERGGWTVTRWN